MATSVTIDLRQVGRGLDTPLRQIQATVELLDEGNTVPFITRYRKDQTGGLDEEQIREIQGRLLKLRMLADRKQTILRSIESQGRLTDELTKQILAATTPKRLEDLYLPYKPKKQTLATLARTRGLEQLAREILEASPSCLDLDARAADFVSTDRQVPTAADALLGAGHILAELISEQAELRGQLREVLQRTGVLVSGNVPTEEKPGSHTGARAAGDKTAAPADAKPEPTGPRQLLLDLDGTGAASPPRQVIAARTDRQSASTELTDAQPEGRTDSQSVVQTSEPTDAGSENKTDHQSVPPTGEPTAAVPESPSAPPPTDNVEQVAEPASAEETPVGETAVAPDGAVPESATEGRPAVIEGPLPAGAEKPAEPPALSAAMQRKLARQQAKEAMRKKRELKKKKLEEKRIKAFSDYFDYREELRKIPPHRVLAINRGERARVLRVRIESDLQAMVQVLEQALVPPGHPHADYLRGCARDALARLILPSLEREIRRELTDKAETHAVSVFAKNLRNLLLQPPVQNYRLLAVDPGYRSGCKLAALDEFGNLLDQGVIYLVSKPDRREEARQKVLELVAQHQLKVIVIGNGTACRQTEDFFAELIEKDLKEQGVAYVIVNEAGASVYSTSRIGRDEFPEYDAVLRGAISIGRRLQDPLSELVKIDPANIGVGLYQHDVKAKHLRTSLDEVVESCVNFVGVDVNTASPALLRYVSGLNQLTARRLYEYRREHGPFRTREQLRDVPGFGEATFVQAAGFLKIPDGENPLDATWIHPESYAAAGTALERLGAKPDALKNKECVAGLAEPITKLDLEPLAKELAVGTLTLKDILIQLVRPGRDPREDLPPPVFKRGVVKLEDLAPGMELTGTVLNVVDFGCFVDIGMHDSGLVHVSRLADKFVRDPHEVVAVGDVVKVWVVGIDKERRRVSLTMIRPGSEQEKRPRHDGRGEGRPAGQRGGRPGGRPQGRPGGGRPGGRPEGAPQGAGQGGGQGAPPRREGRGPQQRPPRPGGGEGRPPRPQGHGRPQREDRRVPPPRPRPAPPKPVIPITEEMKKGKEPMRTFSDLMQFYQHKAEPAPGRPPAAPTQPGPAKAEPIAAAPPPPAIAEPPVVPIVETSPASEQPPEPAAPACRAEVPESSTFKEDASPPTENQERQPPPSDQPPVGPDE